MSSAFEEKVSIRNICYNWTDYNSPAFQRSTQIWSRRLCLRYYCWPYWSLCWSYFALSTASWPAPDSRKDWEWRSSSFRCRDDHCRGTESGAAPRYPWSTHLWRGKKRCREISRLWNTPLSDLFRMRPRTDRRRWIAYFFWAGKWKRRYGGSLVSRSFTGRRDR